MSGQCNGKCVTHPFVDQRKSHRKMYQDGKVYCKTCEYCAKYDGVYCHCCKNRVSRKPVHNRMIVLVNEVKRY